MENKNDYLQNLRHSCAHLLAKAVKDLWPGTHNAIGPAIENGFYQDFDFGKVKISEEDLAKIEGNVLLTFAGDNETPVVLLGEQEARPPYPNEVIYKDNQGTICRRWNWKEVDRTKLTEQTVNAFIVIEGLPPIDREKIQKAVTELVELIKKYCGGEIQTAILDKSNPQVKLL